MGETLRVTDENGVEYEADEDDLTDVKTIKFIDNACGVLEIPYSAEYEVANADSSSDYGNFAVGYNCSPIQGYGSTTHRSTSNISDSFEKTWVFDEMVISK